MPLVKFAGPTDPRLLSTRIGEELVSDSLVRRYEPDGSDGLPGSEATFNLCSFWYVEALTQAGRTAEGQYVFEKMLTYANHVGPVRRKSGRPARRRATSRRPSLTTMNETSHAAVNRATVIHRRDHPGARSLRSDPGPGPQLTHGLHLPPRSSALSRRADGWR